jgi:hypothetical protein
MATAQAVEEMRSRVVLGEFGVRNVSLMALSSGGGMRTEQGWGGDRREDGLGLTAPFVDGVFFFALGSYH